MKQVRANAEEVREIKTVHVKNQLLPCSPLLYSDGTLKFLLECESFEVFNLL